LFFKSFLNPGNFDPSARNKVQSSGFGAATGLNSGQSDRKRDSSPTNVECRMSN